MNLGGTIMKIKLKQLMLAVEHIRYSSGVDTETAEIELSLDEENIENNKLIGSLQLQCDVVKPASAYDKTSQPKIISISVEIFSDHETRPVRASTKETIILDKN